MAQNMPTVQFRKAKKEVRRLYFQQFTAPNAVQNDITLINASTEKVTVMGYKIHIVVASVGALTGNFLEFAWVLNINKNGVYPAVPVINSATSEFMAVMERKLECVPTTGPVVYSYEIDSKSKRIVQKGESLSISIKSPTTEANCNIAWSGEIYVGE